MDVELGRAKVSLLFQSINEKHALVRMVIEQPERTTRGI